MKKIFHLLLTASHEHGILYVQGYYKFNRYLSVMKEEILMIVYCKDDKHSMYVVTANMVASQLLKKPDSVFGMIGFFDENEEVTTILKNWAANGYINFSEASLIEYDEKESYWSHVDMLFYGISDRTKKPRRYECYQAFKNADQVLVVAQGKEQESMVKYIFEESVLSENPAAILKEHENVVLVGDKQALSQMKKEGKWYY